MTREEYTREMKRIDKEIEDHIKIHHSGERAGVLKLVNCQQYKDLQNERWAIIHQLTGPMREKAKRIKKEMENDNGR